MRIETVTFWLVSLLAIGLVLAVRRAQANRLVRTWVARQGWRLGQVAQPVSMRDVVRRWPVVCEVRVIESDGKPSVLKLSLGEFWGDFNDKVRVLSTAPCARPLP